MLTATRAALVRASASAPAGPRLGLARSHSGDGAHGRHPDVGECAEQTADEG
jgi:hypothetical protein